ncbi:MAG: oligosaccharide flippase family protein [Bacteroidales bacterium]|nr:oligosaccharide flippase family protein [Bacteroidales bacterium]
MAVLVLLLGGGGYVAIPYIFHWKADDVRLLQNCFLVMLCGLVVSFPLRSFTGMLGAALRQDISAKVDILYVVAKAVGSVYVVLMGRSILYLALVSVVIDVLYYVLIAYLAHVVYFTLRIDFKSVSLGMAKKLFRYAFFSFINRVAEILKFRVDSLVISFFLTVSNVTVYSVAFRLFDYFNEIVVSVVGFSDSYFSRYEGAGETSELSATFENFTKVSTILSVFIGLSLLFYGKFFIYSWVGNDFSGSYAVLVVLIVPGILMTIQDPLRRIFYATSNHHVLAYLSLGEGAANVILSVILVRSYGLIGVAIGTAIPSLIISLFIIPLYGCAIIKLNQREYWFKSVLLPGSFTTVFVVCYVMLVKDFLLPNFVSIIFLSVFQTLLFIPFCFLVFLNKNEKVSAVNFMRKRLFRS